MSDEKIHTLTQRELNFLIYSAKRDALRDAQETLSKLEQHYFNLAKENETSFSEDRTGA